MNARRRNTYFKQHLTDGSRRWLTLTIRAISVQTLRERNFSRHKINFINLAQDQTLNYRTDLIDRINSVPRDCVERWRLLVEGEQIAATVDAKIIMTAPSQKA